MPTTFAYRLTGPTGTRNGRGTIRVERDAANLAYVTLRLGEVTVEAALSGAHLSQLIADLDACRDRPALRTAVA
jgi:hypothetical protein